MKQAAGLGLAMLALAICESASASVSETRRFYGYAYDLKSGVYLYTEVYDEEVEDGRWMHGGTRYFAPDGRKIGEKQVDFSSDPFIPVYRLDLPEVGYDEGISKVSGDHIEIFKDSPEHGYRTDSIERNGLMVADAGFHCLIVAHMDDLVAGKTLSFKLVVAGKLAKYDFRAHKLDDVEFEGRPAIRVKIEPDSLLRFAIDPLTLIYDPQARRLLDYRGVGNVISPVTRKAYNVHIVYSSKPPDDAPKNLPPLN